MLQSIGVIRTFRYSAYSNRDLGKSAHDLSAASTDLRGRDVDGVVGNNDDLDEQEQPGKRRTVAHRGAAIQERPVRGQATTVRRGPGSRRPPAPVVAPAVQVRVPGAVSERLEREHPERDIEIVAAQPVPVGAQQDVQCAEQHRQCGVRRRFTAAAAEHGQVAVGERYRPVADIAGGVELFAARLQVVVPTVQDAPGPDVRAQFWRGPHPGRGHQARVFGGRGSAEPARRDRPRLRVRAHAVPPQRAAVVRVVVAQQQDAKPAQLPDD